MAQMSALLWHPAADAWPTQVWCYITRYNMIYLVESCVTLCGSRSCCVTAASSCSLIWFVLGHGQQLWIALCSSLPLPLSVLLAFPSLSLSPELSELYWQWIHPVLPDLLDLTSLHNHFTHFANADNWSIFSSDVGGWLLVPNTYTIVQYYTKDTRWKSDGCARG